MARDYKNAGTNPKAKSRPQGSWISFISGLGIGLVAAVGVYFFRGELPQPERSIARRCPLPRIKANHRTSTSTNK